MNCNACARLWLQRQLLLIIFTLPGLMASGQIAEQHAEMRKLNANLQPPMPIDYSRVKAAGIRILESDHLILLTDINSRADIDELPAVFDAAVVQWCAYFGVDIDRTKPWKLRGMVMADRQKFIRARLIPNDLPDFLAGFQRGHEMWVYLQPGNYYTRHLLLHEGTHSFMQWFLGGTGAAWYTEGMAELLGVHRWDAGKLTLNYRLRDRSEAEYWGRIKVIQEDCADGQSKSLDAVFHFPAESFREVRYYAWSWAACEFLSQHPLSKKAFSRLQSKAGLPPVRFNQVFEKSIKKERLELERDWQLFVNEIDFGHHLERGTLGWAAPDTANSRLLRVDASHSWQATDIKVEAGERVGISASGRFVVALEGDRSWPCEAGGVTIEYYRGHPLGQLMVGLLGEDGDITGLLNPTPIGLRRNIKFDRSGKICFRINESPSQLADNNGTLEIEVQRLPTEAEK